MRRRPAVLVATLAAFSLAACGGGTDAGGDATTPSSGSAEAAESVTLTDTLLGDVEVPAGVENVVALQSSAEQLVELGVTPVGVFENAFTPAAYSEDELAELTAIPTIGSYEAIDNEAVIELQPDLIIGFDYGLGLDYQTLSEIAPTVVFSVTSPGEVWDYYDDIAAAVGRTDVYEGLQSDYDAAATALADTYSDGLDGAQAIWMYSYQEGSAYVGTSSVIAASRVQAAGFGYDTQFDADAPSWGMDLDFELLDQISDNAVIFYAAALDGSVDEFTQALLDEPLFAELPAAQSGNTYPFRQTFGYTFAIAQLQLEDVGTAAEGYLASAS